MTLRIATWNVNSVRTRLGHIERFVAKARPDILCLQEIKVRTSEFPLAPFAGLGFEHSVIAGQKGYHGVAIFSTLPLETTPRVDWAGNPDARHLRVMLPGGIELHNFYVPAGGDVPDPAINRKFADKLAFLDAMADHFASVRKDGGEKRIILLGDLNVAPFESDVWSHKQLLKVVTHTEIEVAKMGRLRDSLDWTDAMRRVVPEPRRLFTWWSYRARDWRLHNRGRRLDHIWLTPALAPRLGGMEVHTGTRDWPRPSDHVPVTVDLDL